MARPESRDLTLADIARLRALLAGRGLALAKAPKNPYVDFEARTEGRSILTAYTSGKVVLTVREGDAEGQQIAAALAELAGAPAARKPALARGRRTSVRWLMGLDETGTGELLGSAVIGGALFDVDAAAEVERVAGHVDTKSSRAASGWEDLGERLAGLGSQGLVLTTLAIPNRLFDAWSKNGLLDAAYVRVVGDLFAAGGLDDAALASAEIVIDDYGTGPLLARAVEAWRGRGASVVVTTRADDTYLAARTAAVAARSQRSRQMAALAAEVDDGPVGTGNAGHPETLAWLRRRARRGGAWPSFVKASFSTVRALTADALPDKGRLPSPDVLLDPASARAWIEGRLDVGSCELRAGEGTTRRLEVDATGRLLAPAGAALAWDLLPLLCGGVVLDPSLGTLELLEPLLEREAGLLSGWRVLVGPDDDVEDPLLVALARAHRGGVLTVVRTAEGDPVKRARRHAAALLTKKPRGKLLELLLR